VFTSSEGFSNGIASQGGITTTTELWAVPLRDQERDPLNRDIDNEAQALAAQAAGAGRGGGAGAQAPVTVQIDWSQLARRARQISVPATASTAGRLTGRRSVAFNLTSSTAGAAANIAGIYIVTPETNTLTRVPAGTAADTGAGRGGRGGGGAAAPGGATMAFTRDGRTLYFRQGSNLFAAAVGGGGGGANAAAQRRRPVVADAAVVHAAVGGGAAAAPEASGTARQVTYTASIDVNKKLLRAQVFNEGWRIMKNRFYDSGNARR
jgi:hypothetical protein